MIKLLILLVLTIPIQAQELNRPNLCSKTLQDCLVYSKALEGYVIQLKGQEGALTAKLEASEERLPGWVWGFVGFMAGGFAYIGVHSLVGGGR